jgi:uncharacterized iron-regulated membrane protein
MNFWIWLDWLSTCGSSMFWRRFHGVMAVIWLINIPIAITTGLKSSIVYLIFVSLATAFSGEMSALHGVTVQENQEDGTDGY